MPKTFEFTEELVDEILGYLGEQKYTQVAPLINKIGRVIADADKAEPKKEE